MVGVSRFRRGEEIEAEPSQAVEVKAPRWAIVPLADGAPPPVDATLRTWSEYRAALDTLNRGGAQWQVVPLHELQP